MSVNIGQMYGMAMSEDVYDRLLPIMIIIDNDDNVKSKYSKLYKNYIVYHYKISDIEKRQIDDEPSIFVDREQTLSIYYGVELGSVNRMKLKKMIRYR